MPLYMISMSEYSLFWHYIFKGNAWKWSLLPWPWVWLLPKKSPSAPTVQLWLVFALFCPPARTSNRWQHVPIVNQHQPSEKSLFQSLMLIHSSFLQSPSNVYFLWEQNIIVASWCIDTHVEIHLHLFVNSINQNR